MPLVWGVDPLADLDFAVTTGNGECIVQLPIGYDDDTDNTVSIFVALSPLPGGGGHYEHVFCILDADPASTHEDAYWDGQETVGHFNREDRELVLSLICSATLLAIREIRPPHISHFVHSENLPAIALRKHQVVMGVFREEGYDVKIAPPYHGRQAWVATLP